LKPLFENSVFINCPFDAEYSELLQAMAFTIIYLGFFPRLASENGDNSEPRIERIVALISETKYAIHDLSRCKAEKEGEFARMNMPFELGLDHGARRFGDSKLATKSILVLEQESYGYHEFFSDISGWDIKAHNNKYEMLVRHVRDWLVQQANAEKVGPSKIIGQYIAFQEWYWEEKSNQGASDEEIRNYPTLEVIDAMHQWKALTKPHYGPEMGQDQLA
jgi:hypothetical protein